jgi:imidazoleglycerol phosphate synthase glutamine amidotransferase subunit HisH
MWSAKVDADGELEVWANVRDKGEKERGVLDICLGYQIWIAKEQ